MIVGLTGIVMVCRSLLNGIPPVIVPDQGPVPAPKIVMVKSVVEP